MERLRAMLPSFEAAVHLDEERDPAQFKAVTEFKCSSHAQSQPNTTRASSRSTTRTATSKLSSSTSCENRRRLTPPCHRCSVRRLRCVATFRHRALLVFCLVCCLVGHRGDVEDYSGASPRSRTRSSPSPAQPSPRSKQNYTLADYRKRILIGPNSSSTTDIKTEATRITPPAASSEDNNVRTHIHQPRSTCINA